MKKIIINYGLVLVALFAFFSAGCDTNKEERGSLLRQISTRESETKRLDEQRTALVNKNNQLKTDITQMTNNLEQSRQRTTQLKDSLAAYLLEHKLVTAAILAMGGSAAVIVKDNVDQKTKDTLTGVAIIGAAICLYNASECADVTSKILYYGSEIGSANKYVNEAATLITGKKNQLQLYEKEYVTLTNQINSKAEDRNLLQQKHDSLVCSFCF
ncbi:MAG: hypothetical protein WA584_14615 [Pyrinomonadaceae bacterium]